MTTSAEPRPDLRQPVHFLAFGFGAGLLRPAPGTWGTLVAVPLAYALSYLPLGGYLLVTALVVLSGIWLCGESSRRLGVHDHGGIVWDEIAGYLITVAGLAQDPLWLALGFVFFRLFDILKPWPISWVDRQVGGGLGIMLDDLLAGGLAGLCLWLVVVLSGS
ncbi:MAG: phosphatidylglycerophosphatase A [Pseudomonadota bacterium]